MISCRRIEVSFQSLSVLSDFDEQVILHVAENSIDRTEAAIMAEADLSKTEWNPYLKSSALKSVCLPAAHQWRFRKDFGCLCIRTRCLFCSLLLDYSRLNAHSGHPGSKHETDTLSAAFPLS